MFAFKDIQGAEQVKTLLSTMVARQHFPHATLIVGPEGSEKLRIAYAAACMLLCENPSENDICGTCKACVKSAHLNHPDILYSFPFVKDKDSDVQAYDFLPKWKSLFQENPYMNIYEWVLKQGHDKKQPNINAYECLQIVQKLQMKPFEASSKVMLIWLPEYLEKDGNRLLKIIEEPPPNTYLIMVSENTQAILPTILSRCQIFKVPPMTQPEIYHQLVHHFQKVFSEAETASLLANGNMMEALSLFNDESIEQHNEFVNWLRLCYKGDIVGLVSWLNTFEEYNKEVKKYILKFGIHFISEMMKLKWNFGTEQINLPPHLSETASRMAAFLPIQSIEALINILNNEIYIIQRNGQAKMQLMYTSLQVYHLFERKRASA